MRRHNAGFTVVEIILVMSLMGAVFAVTSTILLRSLDSYQFVTERTVLLERARFAMDRMVRELQLMEAADVLAIGGAGLQGNNTDFSFIGNSLFRGNDLLCPNVTAFGLIYLNGNGVVTATPAQVRRILISLTVQGGGTAGTTLFRSQAALRGVMYEGYL